MSKAFDLIVRKARLIDDDNIVDVAIKDGRIRTVSKKVEGVAKNEIDADGRLTSPGFVDAHMHLDKSFIGGDSKWNCRFGRDAVKLCASITPNFTVEDVKRRAIRNAKMALAKGTTSIRTHIDMNPDVGLTSLKALLEVKKECSGWIDIQIVAFMVMMDLDGEGESLLREALTMGAEVIGGVPYASDPARKFDVFFDVAKDFDAPMDIHVDETNDPEVLFLDMYADKALKARAEGYTASISASHCCSLSAVDDETANRVIRKVKAAEMNVIANPFTNLYLGRGGKPNGVTRVRELLDAGVNVAYATDNTQDPFNPLGNSDMLLAGLFLAYAKDLGGEKGLKEIFEMGTLNAADCGVSEDYGVREGCRADLMVLDAKTPQEAIIKQARRLYVIKNGSVVVRNEAIVF